MRTTLILRLLDGIGALLGWSEVRVEARGDGALWAMAPITVPIDRDGVMVAVSVHWPDVNVEIRIEQPTHLRVTRGDSITLTIAPVMHFGRPPLQLPAVTVRRPTTVQIPVGGVGVIGTS